MTATLKTTNIQHAAASSANITLDSSGNVGIGTASPSQKLVVTGTTGQIATVNSTAGETQFCVDGSSVAGRLYATGGGSQFIAGTFSNHPVTFYANSAEKMRIDTSGLVLINTTTDALTAKLQVWFDGSATQGLTIKNTANSASGAAIRFVDYLGNYSGGGIYYTSSNSITYATTSDYRLKENVAPTSGAVEKVKQLNPVNFNFIGESESIDGFLAHELQAVVPNSVIGEKDAVTASGESKYQVADYAKLVPLLTAALKEAVEKIETLEARVASLEAN